MKNKGQAALILVLLSVVAIIFYAIVMNWGRVAEYKTVTMTAATSAAAQTASSYASYAEKVMQEQLGGKYKICKTSSILGFILKLILAVIIVVLCWGTCIAAAVLLLVISVVTLALQVAVVQPGMIKMWNKMQRKMSTQEQFLVGGLQTGLQNAVDDPVQVTDYQDINSNGLFGFDVANAKPYDKVSRFGFYFTERMKALSGNLLDLKPFLIGLQDLLPLTNVSCADRNSQDPHCNECCQPLTTMVHVQNDANGNPIQKSKPLRPGDCPPDIVPTACTDISVWPHSPTYYYPYDPSYPNYGGTSFLAKLGVDAEVRPFKKGDAKGFFPFLWDMDSYLWDGGTQPKDPATVQASSNGLGAGSLDSRVTDRIGQMDNFQALDNVCVGDPGSGTAAATGFWWKKGAEKYCTTSWPYEQCARDTNCNNNPGINCGCQAGMGQAYPEDYLDDMVYGLRQFYMWSRSLLGQSGDMDELNDTLSSSIDTWYPNAAEWIGPPCTGSNDYVCYDGGRNGNSGGLLHVYLQRLQNWSLLLTAWINRDFSAPDAWCVPDNPNAATNGLSAQENALINAAGPWGSLDGVVACLDYNSLNDQRFKRCYDKITAPTFCSVPNPPMPPECQNLPRSLVPGPLPAFDPCAIPTSNFAQWTQQSYTLSGPLTNNSDALAFQQCGEDVDAAMIVCGSGTPIKPVSCTALPSSPAGPEPGFDICNNAAYRTWTAQSYDMILALSPDIRYTKCQADLRLAETKYCPSGATPPKPATCNFLPTSLAGPEPLFDMCAGTDYKTWVNDTVNDFMYASQPARFRVRANILRDMKQRAGDSLLAINDFRGKLQAFLSGPVDALIQEKTRFATVYVPSVPTFIIYGWRDANPPAHTSRPYGYWHLVRVDGETPGFCPSNKCLTNRLAWVKSYSKGFLTLCYELWDRTGITSNTVRRWDEDHEVPLSFANKMPLWQFKYEKPGTILASAANPEAACAGSINTWKRIGINEPTFQALSQVWNVEINNTTKESLVGAFMISGVPQPSSPNYAAEINCYNTVNQLLNNKGVQTKVCAQYGLSPDRRHIQVTFVKCPK